MGLRVVSGLMLALLLVSMVFVVFDVPVVVASGTIYIRADGSIDPQTAPIHSVDNITYTFTDNINDFLVIERSNIIVDGAGYTLYGNGSGKGIDLVSFGYLSNITITNIEIRDFEYGISAEWCWDLNISRNTIQTNSELHGIWLHWSFNNVLAENNITASALAVYLDSCFHNTFVKNRITWNYAGICLIGSSSNHIVENNITNNQLRGVWLDSSSNNTLVGNNITDNGVGILLTASSNNNTLAENNIRGDPNDNTYGISLHSSLDNTIVGNNITENGWGDGIKLETSSYNNLTKNNITSNGSGVRLYYSSNCRIVRNNITNNGWGIGLTSSSNNTLTGNNITANSDYGIHLIDSSNNNTLTENNATNNSWGIYLGASLNNTIAENNVTSNSFGIYLSASSNNTLTENNVANNYGSIHLGGISNYNSIIGNNASNSDYGVYLDNSSNNTLAENNVTGNGYCGIWLEGSSNNHIFHNNFADNLIQAVTISCVSVWDDGYPSGGNYWSDYGGVDFYNGPYQNLTGCDGVGDTPYTIIDTNNKDRYPLMKPYPQIPDVALINVTLSKTVLGFGYNVLINITVENQNCFTETFNVTLYAQWEPPAFPIGTIKVSNLTSGEIRTIAFTCNTSAIGKGYYTIIGVADTVPRETEIADNRYTNGLIHVTKVGDLGGGVPPKFFECDDKVDGKDYSLFLQCYKCTCPPEAKYLGDLGGGVPPKFYKCDGKVDGKDYSLFLQCYKGQGPPDP